MDFILYLIIATIVYIITYLVGKSLDNKFNKAVTYFVDGSEQKV